MLYKEFVIYLKCMKLKDLQKKIQDRTPNVTEKVQKDLAFQIGTQIEVARARKGMTQKELAERVGTKQPSIARIESGVSLPSVLFLIKIANALGLNLDVSIGANTKPRVQIKSPVNVRRVGRVVSQK